MTKTYEEIIRGDLSELHNWAATNEILGEITMVIAGYDQSTKTFETSDLIAEVLKQESAGISRKDAIAEVARASGISKRTVFDAMVTHKSGDKI
jgi:16S rRNA (cytidine1402-2'-O)-methyltransferase